nr:MAG TPA: hypothetical protein [Microviridae sp.]
MSSFFCPLSILFSCYYVCNFVSGLLLIFKIFML